MHVITGTFLIQSLADWLCSCCTRFWMKLVEVLLYVHWNHRFIRDRSPGRPPRLSHSSWALRFWMNDCILLQFVTFSIHQSGVLTVLWFGCCIAGATWNCCRLGASSAYTIQCVWFLLLLLPVSVWDFFMAPFPCFCFNGQHAPTILDEMGVRDRHSNEYWPGVILDELGHRGSWDWKRGWVAIFAHSTLAFDLMTSLIKHDPRPALCPSVVFLLIHPQHTSTVPDTVCSVREGQTSWAHNPTPQPVLPAPLQALMAETATLGHWKQMYNIMQP